MKTGTIICIATFILGSLLSILQLWFELIPAEIFVKAMITLGVVFVVVLGTTLASREYIENKKLRNSGHID